MSTVFNKKPVAKKAAAKKPVTGSVEKFYIAVVNICYADKAVFGPDTLNRLVVEIEAEDYDDLDFEGDVTLYEVANKTPVSVKVTKSVEII